MERKQTGLLEGSAAFFISSVIVFAARFTISIIVARTLGVEGKGIYALVLMTGSLLVLFFSLGLNGAITYLTASSRFTARELFSYSMSSAVILSMAGGLAFYIAYVSFLSDSFLTGLQLSYIWLIIIVLPINLISLFVSSILLGKQQIVAFNSINIIRTYSNLILQILSAVLGYGIFGALLSWFISNIVALFATLWLLRMEINFTISRFKEIFKVSTSFGIKSYIANLFSFINYRLDTYIVNYYSGPNDVGLYSTSVSAAELIWYVPNSISSALFPKSSSLEKNTAARLTAQVCRQILLLTTLMCVIFAIIGPILIPLFYGDAFLAAVRPFLWLLPGILGIALTKIISANLSGLGKPQYTTYTSIITVVVTIVLDVALIPGYGIVGAAVASSIAYIASSILSVMWFSRETNIPWDEVVFVRRNDVISLVNRIMSLLNEWMQLARSLVSR